MYTNERDETKSKKDVSIIPVHENLFYMYPAAQCSINQGLMCVHTYA